MKNILVATDFSNDAYCALFYITKLMTSRPCSFFILNVFNELTPLEGKKNKIFGDKKLFDQLELQSRGKLVQTVHRIVLDNNEPQHQFQTLSDKGSLSKVILKTIDDYQIDLLVMGSKGKTGAKEIFLGGNTIQVANTMTKCPILAVPKQIDYKLPIEIAFVTDFKRGCAQKTIAPLLSLASLTMASIRVLHINEEEILDKEQESNRKLLELYIKKVDHSFHWMQKFAEKAQVIDEFLEKLAIDIFAMVHFKRSFIETLVGEPIIKDVSIYSNIPFLILPSQD